MSFKSKMIESIYHEIYPDYYSWTEQKLDRIIPGNKEERERVKKLISERGVNPQRILVTTFTNKAADELKVKLARSVGKDAELIHISTIHSFCKSMLEKYFLFHNYGASIEVLDEDGRKLFIEINKVQLGLGYWKDGRLHNLKHSFNYIGEIKSLFDKRLYYTISLPQSG